MALRNGLPLVFGELLFEQKCTVVVKNDFPRSHLHHVQYYVTDYIPAAQTYVNTFPRSEVFKLTNLETPSRSHEQCESQHQPGKMLWTPNEKVSKSLSSNQKQVLWQSMWLLAI